jgi:hypothetical protein
VHSSSSPNSRISNTILLPFPSSPTPTSSLSHSPQCPGGSRTDYVQPHNSPPLLSHSSSLPSPPSFFASPPAMSDHLHRPDMLQYSTYTQGMSTAKSRTHGETGEFLLPSVLVPMAGDRGKDVVRARGLLYCCQARWGLLSGRGRESRWKRWGKNGLEQV